MNDPTDTDATQRELADKAKRERQLQEQRRVTLRKVLSSENGRTFVMDLIDDGRLFRLSMDLDSPESTHLTAFREGRRSVATDLTREIVNSCPDLWQRMLRERADRMDQR